MPDRLITAIGETLGGVSSVVERVVRTHPVDVGFIADAVTVMIGRPDEPPMGLSAKRMLQRRCVLVLTDRRLILESSLLVPALWLGVFLLCSAVAMYGSTWEFAYLLVAFVIFGV